MISTVTFFTLFLIDNDAFVGAACDVHLGLVDDILVRAYDFALHHQGGRARRLLLRRHHDTFYNEDTRPFLGGDSGRSTTHEWLTFFRIVHGSAVRRTAEIGADLGRQGPGLRCLNFLFTFADAADFRKQQQQEKIKIEESPERR